MLATTREELILQHKKDILWVNGIKALYNVMRIDNIDFLGEISYISSRIRERSRIMDWEDIKEALRQVEEVEKGLLERVHSS